MMQHNDLLFRSDGKCREFNLSLKPDIPGCGQVAETVADFTAYDECAEAMNKFGVYAQLSVCAARAMLSLACLFAMFIRAIARTRSSHVLTSCSARRDSFAATMSARLCLSVCSVMELLA